MKKNIMKKGVALLCAFTLSIGFTSCDLFIGAMVDDTYDVWTTYNTTKVLRDVELSGDYVRMEKGINVKMAKNESEMGSLYITTHDKGVDKFDLIAQPLTNENGDEFSVENMEVMAQRYIEISVKSRGNYLEEFPLGSYAPDAIVGMDLYKKAKENPVMLAFALCITGYACHNIFCYQQVCCTPFLFIALGIGESLTKSENFNTIK